MSPRDYDDFNAICAHAKIDTHEKVCTERYGNINQQLLQMNARLNAMSGRMWAGVVGVLIIMTGAFGTIALAYISGKH